MGRLVFRCMLMAVMRRWNLTVVLIATIALATLPILHNHSLIPHGIGGSPSTSTIQCAFCATTCARTTVAAPQLATPLAMAAEFVALTAPAVGVVFSGELSSRAPPAAA
jgi:hypothetical protein